MDPETEETPTGEPSSAPANGPAGRESPPAPSAPAATPVEQLQALTIEQLREQLAARDERITGIGAEKSQLQNDNSLTVAERDRLAAELAQAITDRTAIDAELQKREAEHASQLEAQTAAAQTATAQAHDAQSELATERGRRVKAEIILKEYPDLSAYAEIISPNEDPEMIRSACKAIKAANEKVLATQRQVMATGVPPTTPSTPARTEPDVDPTRIDGYLREGWNEGGKEEYERRRKAVLDQLAGVRPHA